MGAGLSYGVRRNNNIFMESRRSYIIEGWNLIDGAYCFVNCFYSDVLSFSKGLVGNFNWASFIRPKFWAEFWKNCGIMQFVVELKLKMWDPNLGLHWRGYRKRNINTRILLDMGRNK